MCTPFSRIPQAQLMRLDSFFSGALCVVSGGRLPEALLMVFLLYSKGAKVLNQRSPYSNCQSSVLSAPSFLDFPRPRCIPAGCWFILWGSLVFFCKTRKQNKTRQESRNDKIWKQTSKERREDTKKAEKPRQQKDKQARNMAMIPTERKTHNRYNLQNDET